MDLQVSTGGRIVYEIWYIPRIHDEVLCWKFDNVNEAHYAMTQIKNNRPKAYPHHYIWNSVTKTKIKHEEQFDEYGWWAS